MYAIVEHEGKQYKVLEGERLEVDLDRELQPGDELTFDHVLMIVDGEKTYVGTPEVSGARVRAVVVGPVPGPKLTVFHYKPKKRVRSKTGHREWYTAVTIDRIWRRAPRTSRAAAAAAVAETSTEPAATGPAEE